MNLLNPLLRKLYKNWEIQDNLSIQTQTYLLIMSNTRLQKIVGIIALLASSLALSNPASALTGFQGDYAPNNWTFLNTDADGNVDDITNDPTSITLIGEDDQTGNPEKTDYTIIVEADGTLSFDWNYTTVDAFPDAEQYDPSVFWLNGDLTQSTDNVTITNFDISDRFGCINCRTNVAISNFDISPVTPVPFEFSPVLGLGVLGGVWAGKRFLKSRKTK